MKYVVIFYYDIGFKRFEYNFIDDILNDLLFDLHSWFLMAKRVEICKIDN